MIRAFPRPPVFSDPEKTRRAGALFALIWTNTLVGMTALLGIMATQHEIMPAAITNFFILAFMAAALFALGRRGRISIAAWLLIGIDVASTTFRAAHAGGIRSPGVTLFFVYPLMAGLMLGEASGIATAVVCASLGLGLVLAEQNGVLPLQTMHYNSFTYWWIGCFYMGLVIYLLRLATQNVKRALARAEAELADRRKTEQHLNIALKAAAIGIWDGDLRGVKFWADERTASIMALPRAADGTITFDAWRGVVHPDDLPIVRGAIETIVQEEVHLGRVEYRLRLPGGEIRHVEATGTPVRGKDGEILSHAGTFRDVTERKKAETEREQSQQQRRSLETQLLQAQKKEALGILASGIAHDFNNLLGAIQGFSGILEEDAAPGSQSRQFAERITAACGRGKDIVNQILTFARTNSQAQQDIELCELLRECEALLPGQASEHASVNFTCAQQELYIRGNGGQLLRLVTNLCMNAAESFEGTGGHIEVTLDRPNVATLALAGESRPNSHTIGKIDPARAYARIRVQDNGSGIAPDILQQIFDPFFTTKGRQRGSGLGLAACQGIVESHGGFCIVESQLGKGTTFSVFFPVLDAPLLKSQPAAATPRTIKGTERVLVVDDEPDIADWLKIGLGRLGYRVSTFNAPLQALEAFRASPQAWDVVIADQIMPSMRGAQFLEMVKASNPKVLTVLCSGHSEEDDTQMQDMAELRLPKPIALADLSGSIRAILDARAGR